MNRSRLTIVVAICLVAMLAGGQLLRASLGGGAALSRSRLFDEVLSRVERNYVDSLDAAELYRRAANGLVAELHDPNSQLLSERRARALAENASGAYEGVGVQVDVRDGWIQVIAPLPGSPAELAGLRPGDRILEIDGQPASLHDDAHTSLRGKPGTTVTVLVERPGSPAHFTLAIRRAAIHLDAVRHAMLLRPGVGYLQLTIFSESSDVQLRRAVAALRAEGARTLVVDLRSDPGGLLAEGVAVADEFLDRGQMVVSLRGRVPEATRTITDVTAQRWPELVLVALVDGGSASASELVAGAWQDHDRAAVVGSTSYGKGSAQSLFPLAGDSGALRLTTAYWFTPSGRSIQRRDRGAQDSATAADSVAEPPLAKRRAYRTDAGRVVYGGGGITPDLIVAPQDSIDGALALARALGKELPRFRDAVTDVAASARASGAVRGTSVTVTPAMRDALWRRAQGLDLRLSRAAFDSASAAVDRMLADEIVRDALGGEAAWRQRLDADRVVAAALALTDGASSEKDVLARAAALRAAHREDVPRAP